MAIDGATVSRVTARDRTLLLLRHAKSEYPYGVGDHGRPLAPRGVREAGLAGDWLRARAPVVDAVLCSTAVRTRETLLRTGIEAATHFTDDLYDSTPETTLEVIHRVDVLFDAEVTTLLVVGHEPTNSMLALGLAADGDAAARARMSTKYPTSALAVLSTTRPWCELEFGGATLVAFHVPR